MHSNIVQLPPDSTGKKMTVVPTWVIGVPNSAPFSIKDIIDGASSGAHMIVVQKSATCIYAQFTTQMQEGTMFTLGENILIDGIVVSAVNVTPFPIYFNPMMIVSYDNPSYGQRVDAQGQAYIRYEDGAQILDAVGRTKTVLDNICGAYKFNTLADWDIFMQTTVVGTAGKTLDPYHKGLKLSTGTTTGDSIDLMSHKYHMHLTGTGLYAELLYQCGDIGKENLVREWGYSDYDNGLFFNLIGTALSITIRNNSTGSPVDSVYPQMDWNRDKLDGTGISGINLNLSKVNKYWFDIHRGVRFRVGIYGPNGSRVVCHDVLIANTGSALSIPTTSLPIRVLQKNTGTVLSTSESTFYEGSVLTEGDMKLHTHFYEAGGVVKTVTSAAWVPLVSLRPQTNSKHTIAILSDALASAVLATDANMDGRVKLEIFKNATLTDSTFAVTKGDSRFNVDTAATAMTGGTAIVEFFLKGTGDKEINGHMSYLDEFLIENIDGTKNIYTLGAKAIAADCSVLGAINWNEYFVR